MEKLILIMVNSTLVVVGILPKFMIQCLKESEYKDDSKNIFRVGLYVFDMSLKKIWGREIEMPYTEKKMDLSDFALDSKGNAYIDSAKVYNNNSTKEKVRGGIVNYHFEILMANANKDLIITKVNLGEKFFVSSIIMLEGPKENMICVGYSKSGDYYTNVNGLFKFNVKIGTEIIEKITYDIPEKIINQNVSGYQKFKNESKESNNDKESVGIYNLLMKKLIVDSDGSLIVIGEREYTEYSSNGKSSSTTYCFDDILITKIDSTGKLEWMKNSLKQQPGGRHGSGSSFKWIYSGKNHYLLYLDNIKNLQLSIDKVPEVHVDGAGGYLTSYKIEDATGAVEKAAVFDTRNVDGIFVTQFRTDRIFSIGDNEFLIEMYKKKMKM